MDTLPCFSAVLQRGTNFGTSCLLLWMTQPFLSGPSFNPIALRKAKIVYPIALRKAKIVYNFGLSECNRGKEKNSLLEGNPFLLRVGPQKGYKMKMAQLLSLKVYRFTLKINGYTVMFSAIFFRRVTT